MKLRLDPYKCKPLDTQTKDAWCYEDSSGLQVFMQNQAGTILSCLVSRRTIETYLKHMLMQEGADLAKFTGK